MLKNSTDEALKGVRDVTLKWVFDAAGSPYELMERLISFCHVIGEVERLLCWRYGALFRSHEPTKRIGRNVRLYTMVIRYDKKHDALNGNEAYVLRVRMMGPFGSPKVWTSLRFVASAVVTLSKEWPGVIVKGSPVCPRHPMASTDVYLTVPEEARLGDQLIRRAAQAASCTGCKCHAESNEVIRLAVRQLGPVIDIQKDPFEGEPDTKIPQPDSEPPLPDDGPPLMERGNFLRNNRWGTYMLWLPYAWQTAVGLWGLSLVLFGGVTAGFVEDKQTFWHVCLVIMILSLVGAVIASVVSYQEMRRREIEAVWRRGDLPTHFEDDVEIPLIANSGQSPTRLTRR